VKLGSISPPLWTAPRYRDKAVEDAVGKAVDPVPAVTDFAIGHIGEIGPKRSADPAEHLFRRIERDAADQQ
jgi:hypothetical protein